MKIADQTIVLVGSDLCPTVIDEALFRAGDKQALLGSFQQLWAEADYRVLNLECPLTGSDHKIRKAGPHLKAETECASFLSASKTDAVGLANNHLCDYGAKGVLETLETLTLLNIATVGGGANIKQARQPLCIRVNGVRLGIMAMAEAEFSIANGSEPGANPIDYRNFTLLRELRRRSDFVLILLHGGVEYLQFPRPGLVDLCRFLVDQGAGAVIVQHTHCVGCYELYQRAPIVYGQGNFIFGTRGRPLHSMSPLWFEGMLCELRVSIEHGCRMIIHPYEQSRGFVGIRALAEERRELFLKELEARSRLLEDPSALQEKWVSFVRTVRDGVLARSFGFSGIITALHRRVPFMKLCTTSDGMRRRHNMIRCESHRELLQDCLKAHHLKEY